MEPEIIQSTEESAPDIWAILQPPTSTKDADQATEESAHEALVVSLLSQ